MVKLLTKASTELTSVESDPEVAAARERHEALLTQKREWEAEWRTNARRLNPNSSSQDHRVELTVPERIRAEERQAELAKLLRLLPTEIEPAAAALASERRRAYDARYPVARQRVRERLGAFYAAVEAVAAGPHAALLSECEQMNQLLKSPTAGAAMVPPPFDPLLLCWAELEVDGPVSARRRYLAQDDWLP